MAASHSDVMSPAAKTTLAAKRRKYRLAYVPGFEVCPADISRGQPRWEESRRRRRLYRCAMRPEEARWWRIHGGGGSNSREAGGTKGGGDGVETIEREG
jgi:hypothetical protein